MLAVGDIAPDFTLADQDGRPVTLGDLLKDGPALLYFYPADFTPVCTREACSFAELEPDFTRAGVRLAGVSPQGGESHQRFRARYGLKFTLLSDPERRVIRAYGCDGLFGLRVSETCRTTAASPVSVRRGLGSRGLGVAKAHICRADCQCA